MSLNSKLSPLFEKYDVPAPRYTSYPTVPYWTDSPTASEWMTYLNRAFSRPEMSWSIYLHLPFCETLCTFCGCNTVTTRDHGVEEKYIDLIHREWKIYREGIENIEKRPLRQIHLGGGTPTFFSPSSLKKMLEPILGDLTRDSKHFDASIEVDPRRTSEEHLSVLYKMGFRRVSMGVQDFSEDVQRMVNRHQPYEITRDLTEVARRLGYDSVNFDLIYGLPKQTLEGFKDTARRTIELRPDRIALYSFALVPWIKKTHRIFKDEDLPVAKDKRDLYESARGMLLDAGYIEIGMDHFALPNEALALAMKNGELHRNFMGYTETRTDVMIGLGLSAISETPECFQQNQKVLPVYERMLLDGQLPIFRGHQLTQVDQKDREQILTLMTTYEVGFQSEDQEKEVFEFLASPREDQLIEFRDHKLFVTELGRPFLRNVCMAFDRRLRASVPTAKVFSKSV